MLGSLSLTNFNPRKERATETLEQYKARTSKRTVFDALADIENRNREKEVKSKVFEIVTDENKQKEVLNSQRGKHKKFCADLKAWYEGLEEVPETILISLNAEKKDRYFGAKTDSLYGGLLGALDTAKMKDDWRLIKKNDTLWITKL